MFLEDKFYESDGANAWTQVYPNSCIVVKADTPVFYNDTFVSDDGVTPTITGDAGLRFKATHCRLNTNIDVGIFNFIPVGYNVVDIAVEV